MGLANDRRWQGPIPYRISPDLTNPIRVTDAITELERHTNIRFVVVDKQEDIMFFTQGDRCETPVFNGNGQSVFIRPESTVGGILHEIVHALGLRHEHQRSDGDNHRDNFVRVISDNIDDEDKIHFYALGGITGEDYDNESIMHYQRNEFAIEPGDTLEPTTPPDAVLDQRETLANPAGGGGKCGVEMDVKGSRSSPLCQVIFISSIKSTRRMPTHPRGSEPFDHPAARSRYGSRCETAK